jgi:hypothetical protein
MKHRDLNHIFTTASPGDCQSARLKEPAFGTKGSMLDQWGSVGISPPYLGKAKLIVQYSRLLHLAYSRQHSHFWYDAMIWVCCFTTDGSYVISHRASCIRRCSRGRLNTSNTEAIERSRNGSIVDNSTSEWQTSQFGINNACASGDALWWCL